MPGGARLDSDRIRQAYVEHSQELYAFSLRSVGDVAAAEDVVQEAFLRAWRARSQYDSKRGSLRTWLFQITRNVIVDYHRAAAIRPFTASEVLPEVGTSQDQFEWLVFRCVIAEALTQISAEQRYAIEQTYLADRTYREVARELGVAESTLRSRVFYGLKALRAVLDQEVKETPR